MSTAPELRGRKRAEGLVSGTLVLNPNRLKSGLGEIKATYSSKRENMRRMIEVDESYARSSAAITRTRRCCTGCKTPFGICAQKECRCHA